MERNNKRECDKGDIKHFALGQESVRSWARNTTTDLVGPASVTPCTLRAIAGSGSIPSDSGWLEHCRYCLIARSVSTICEAIHAIDMRRKVPQTFRSLRCL